VKKGNLFPRVGGRAEQGAVGALASESRVGKGKGAKKIESEEGVSKVWRRGEIWEMPRATEKKPWGAKDQDQGPPGVIGQKWSREGNEGEKKKGPPKGKQIKIGFCIAIFSARVGGIVFIGLLGQTGRISRLFSLRGLSQKPGKVILIWGEDSGGPRVGGEGKSLLAIASHKLVREHRAGGVLGERAKKRGMVNATTPSRKKYRE